jgi:hypothetical protein
LIPSASPFQNHLFTEQLGDLFCPLHHSHLQAAIATGFWNAFSRQVANARVALPE